MIKFFLVVLLSLCTGPSAWATELYPEKDLTVIVPFAPGGGVDVTVRFFGEMDPIFFDDKKIHVQNLPGGGGSLGQSAAAKAKPDGYTLLAFTNSALSNPVFKKTPFTHQDFVPVFMYCFDPQVLVVPAGSPYKNIKDFLDAARNTPVRVATPGEFTVHHLAGIMLAKAFDSRFSYVHSSSATQQVSHLLSGRVAAALMTYGEASSYLQDGTLQVLGLMSDKDYSGAERIERFSRYGFHSEWGAFRGFAVPAATPPERVRRLSAMLGTLTADRAFTRRMQAAGYPVQIKDADDFARYAHMYTATLRALKNSLETP